MLRRAAGKEGSGMAGAFEELGRLQADVSIIVFEGEVVVTAGKSLADFTGTDFPGGSGDDAAEVRRRVVGGEDERVGEEGVAEQHGRVGAVGAVRGVAAVTGVGSVQDVVMDERGEVHEFDDAGPADERFGRRTAGAGAEGEQRAEPLAGMGEHVAYHRADLRFENEFLRREEFLQRSEVGFKSGV